jgi:hypothetical protein
LPNIIIFQYNPEQLSHRLNQQGQAGAGSGKEKKETFRTPGAQKRVRHDVAPSE